MSDMTKIRDPKTDSLLTPQNAVLALIDYQPEQYTGVASVGHEELVAHVTMLGRVATTFELPIVLSTVYVKHGMTDKKNKRYTPSIGLARKSGNETRSERFSSVTPETSERLLVTKLGFVPRKGAVSRAQAEPVRAEVVTSVSFSAAW